MRTRLTLWHAALTFVCCAILVVLTALLPLLTARSTVAAPGQAAEPISETNLPDLMRDSVYILVSLAGISLAVGWLIAGRALRPLDVITASARALSANTLDSSLRVPAAYREFTELADTLEGLRKRLHESFTAQRQFIANASHELRTPLTVQRTLLQLTLADPEATADTLRSACRDLLDLGRQQEDLIDALLTLARGHQGIEHWEQFDLADLTRKIVDDHAAEAESRGIRLRAQLMPVTVAGDSRLAASLVTNLVVNALRHNVAGGTVEIITAAPGRLSVGNTGEPIPLAKIGRLFQPFQRLGPDRLSPHESSPFVGAPSSGDGQWAGVGRQGVGPGGRGESGDEQRGVALVGGDPGGGATTSGDPGGRATTSEDPRGRTTTSEDGGAAGSGSGSAGSSSGGSDGGHGLGLAIVAAIADAHRASVAAVPKVGGGLVVTVDFPVAQYESYPAAEQRGPSGAAEVEASERARSGTSR
ncbi:sensor histidine kinase [Actinoplanes philippinensis]|uniref:sensor histidine kinase n=1 Tax=Actinoplanes philippinensis TaxID=35752 RepID=UPI0033DFEEC9